MNILALYSSKNAHGKKDASGAFIPEAKAFASCHKIPDDHCVGMPLVGVSSAVRRQRTLETIYGAGSRKKLDAIAFFGHGWPRGIQFGFRREHIHGLVRVLSSVCAPNVKIILYACLAAENDVREREIKNIGPGTDGGFADMLRDEMVRQGLDLGHVDAHKTAGHTTWNPFLIRFLCEAVEDQEKGGEGGAWIVAPRSQLWKEWVRRLKMNEEDFRYRFPFLTEYQIKRELMGLPPDDFDCDLI